MKHKVISRAREREEVLALSLGRLRFPPTPDDPT